MKISNFKLAIGIPLSFPFVPASFFHSFVQMDRPSYTYLHADNGHIDDLRNNLIAKAKEINATHLCMMDVDQVYHPETVTRMLSRKLPIVGALVHRRYMPFDSLMLKAIEIDEHTNGYVSIEDWEPNSLVSVDATGGGCLMFDMQVFHDLDKLWQQEIDDFNLLCPTVGELSLLSEKTQKYLIGLQAEYVPPRKPGRYFRTKSNPDGTPIGEDISFCRELKSAGYDIFVDTSVPAGHLANMVITELTGRLYRAMKSNQARKSLTVDNPGDL